MIRFELNQGNNKLQLRAVLKKLENIICKEFKKNGIISVAFVSSAEIKKLNRKYRKKDKSTDILTFILDDGEILGEIILSSAEIKKRAKSAGRGLLEATIYLIIHGVCHIFGHTHQGKNDTKNMEAKERKIFNYVYKSVI